MLELVLIDHRAQPSSELQHPHCLRPYEREMKVKIDQDRAVRVTGMERVEARASASLVLSAIIFNRWVLLGGYISSRHKV